MDSKVLVGLGHAAGSRIEFWRGIRTSMGEITVQTRTCSIFSHDFTNASLTTRAYLPLAFCVQLGCLNRRLIAYT